MDVISVTPCILLFTLLFISYIFLCITFETFKYLRFLDIFLRDAKGFADYCRIMYYIFYVIYFYILLFRYNIFFNALYTMFLRFERNTFS